MEVILALTALAISTLGNTQHPLRLITDVVDVMPHPQQAVEPAVRVGELVVVEANAIKPLAAVQIHMLAAAVTVQPSAR